MTERRLLYIFLGLIMLGIFWIIFFKDSSEVKELREMNRQYREDYLKMSEQLQEIANDSSKYNTIHHETKIYLNRMDDLDTNTIDSLYSRLDIDGYINSHR